ncbi:MAG: hypothetical protein AAFN78_10260 [Pseudomonadota bacterium]
MAFLAAAAFAGCEYKPPSVSLTADAAYNGDIINSYVDTSTGYVIGGSVSRKWLPVSDSVARLNYRQSWWVYGIGRALGRVDSGPAQPAGSGCEGWRVEFLDLGPKTSDAFAILGRWNGAPRKAEYQSLDHPAYMSLVSETLADHGIASADITLTANLRIDLDDDGIDEVVLSATNMTPGEAGAESDSYSVVLLRKSTVSGVFTRLLTHTLVPEGCSSCDPAVHRVGGLVDLNGDGNVEIIVRTTSRLASGGTVFAASGLEPEEVLTWSCPYPENQSD